MVPLVDGAAGLLGREILPAPEYVERAYGRVAVARALEERNLSNFGPVYLRGQAAVPTVQANLVEDFRHLPATQIPSCS